MNIEALFRPVPVPPEVLTASDYIAATMLALGLSIYVIALTRTLGRFRE
jgi:hypothetical protein